MSDDKLFAPWMCSDTVKLEKFEATEFSKTQLEIQTIEAMLRPKWTMLLLLLHGRLRRYTGYIRRYTGYVRFKRKVRRITSLLFAFLTFLRAAFLSIPMFRILSLMRANIVWPRHGWWYRF